MNSPDPVLPEDNDGEALDVVIPYVTRLELAISAAPCPYYFMDRKAPCKGGECDCWKARAFEA